MPYALGLLGSLPRVDQGRQQRLTPIVGAPPSLVNLPPGCPFTPRSPLAQDIRDTVEPDPVPTDRRDHLAACHFHESLIGVDASQLYRPTSLDTEDMTAADLPVPDTFQARIGGTVPDHPDTTQVHGPRHAAEEEPSHG